jgi:hypothetical protein
MQYPEDFPPESRAAVAAEKLRSGKDFDEFRQNPRRMVSDPRRPQYDFDEHFKAELRKYILRQFSVFVREACKLGHRGIWHVDRIEEAALEFLRLSTIDAVYSKGHYKSGAKISLNWIGTWGGYIEPHVQRQFEQSVEWQQFQDELLQVAEGQQQGIRELGKPDAEIGNTTADSACSEQTEGTSSKPGDAPMCAQELTVATTDREPDPRTEVDAFLRRCNQESAGGFRVIKKHIWLAAGHGHARQFQYWQQRSGKATDEDDRNFRRILGMGSADFIALLTKKHICP